jgi:hypothetical protein
MPPGAHKVSLVCVDRATNQGAAAVTHFYSDPDTPTISWADPTGSVIDPRTRMISVNASDLAGDPVVTLSLGATALATITAPPYAITPDLSSVATGTYTLTATVTDHLNRTVTISKSVTWNPHGLAGVGALTSDSAVDIADGVSIGVSSTNPGAQDDMETWWRQGWGNSLTPQFLLTPPTPGSEYGLVTGMLYSVTTEPSSIDTSTPEAYYRTARGSATNLNETIDLRGIYNFPPLGGWRPTPIFGASSGIEGPWYFNLIWFTSRGYTSSRTYHIPMGIDLTPPSKVESMVVSPTTDSDDATSVIPTSRIHISWTPKEYDALSGVAYYQISIDGTAAIPDSASNPPQGRVYAVPGVSPRGVTIENLPTGRHVVSVQAVDRATNVGTATSTVVYSDPDTPTVSITSPSGSALGVNPKLTAVAGDKGGIVSVVFRLDGSTLATYTTAPYSGTADLSGFSTGAGHVLTATVTDRFGRQVTARKTVSIDSTPLRLLRFSRTPTTFYPIKRDKYYDDSYITFKLNKAVTAKVTIKNSSGTTVKTLYKGVNANESTTIKWDGKWASDGKAKKGTYYYVLSATDSAGYSVTSSRLTTYIKNYQLVRVGGGIRVIAR